MDSNLKSGYPNTAKNIFSKGFDQFFTDLYNGCKFIIKIFRQTFTGPFEFKETVKQCYQIGYLSLPLISMTGFITGLVFTKQSRPSLAEFGATSWLPSLISIAILRALAPLVTALIAAGKVGSQIGAELGSMKVTEQIDAMEVSATNPFKFLVVSRVVATTLMIPILMMYTAFVAMIGAFLDIHSHELTSFISFIEKAFERITFLDLTSSLVKSIVFGFTIGAVGSYKGYNASQGTEGVGKAANAAVVLSMFLIFLEEIIIVQITNFIRG